MYSDELMSRKYLINNDLPTWMRKEEKETIMSRSKLWLAFYLKIRNDDGSIRTPQQLHIFKRASQGVYNGEKPGVDKAKELGQLILLTGLKLNF